MSDQIDILEKLGRSLVPFWHHTRDDVIGDAMAEITNLRAILYANSREVAVVPLEPPVEALVEAYKVLGVPPDPLYANVYRVMVKAAMISNGERS